MPRECYFTGKRTVVGRKLRYRGKAKYLGGIGKKVTASTKRTMKPNLHVVSAMIDGKAVRIKVSTRAIKKGLIIKPQRRRYTYKHEAAKSAA